MKLPDIKIQLPDRLKVWKKKPEEEKLTPETARQELESILGTFSKIDRESKQYTNVNKLLSRLNFAKLIVKYKSLDIVRLSYGGDPSDKGQIPETFADILSQYTSGKLKKKEAERKLSDATKEYRKIIDDAIDLRLTPEIAKKELEAVMGKIGKIEKDSTQDQLSYVVLQTIDTMVSKLADTDAIDRQYVSNPSAKGRIPKAVMTIAKLYVSEEIDDEDASELLICAKASYKSVLNDAGFFTMDDLMEKYGKK
jgi:hypothetical protein